MARVNVDDELWHDPRFNELCKQHERHVALGAVVMLWRLGQEHWKNDKRLIPSTAFKFLPLCEDLEKFGFVEKREDGVYCSGAEERWGYFFENSERGRKGGQRSAQIRKERYGSAIPINATNLKTEAVASEKSLKNPKQNPKPIRSQPKQTEASSSSSSSSYLVNNNKLSNRVAASTNNEPKQTEAVASEPPDTFENVQDVSTKSDWAEIEVQAELDLVANTSLNERKRPVRRVKDPAPSTELFEAFNVAYKQRYGVEVARSSRSSAMLKNMLARIGRDDSLMVIQYYLTHNKAFYVQEQHELRYMVHDCEKLRTEALTGKRVSSNQAKILERDQANGDAIRKHVEKRMAQFRQAAQTEPAEDEQERGAEA